MVGLDQNKYVSSIINYLFGIVVLLLRCGRINSFEAFLS